MSRIGRKPVAIPGGVTVSITDSTITVKGSKGELHYVFLPEVAVKVDGSEVLVERAADTLRGRAMHGLTRQLVANMIQGVNEGFSKKLEIIGVGYKAAIKGDILVLNLGFSHTIDYAIPKGIDIIQDEKNKNMITVHGIDKQLVGQVAAEIRSYRPPEPYKGKGVRYSDEVVRRKPGKSAAKGS